MNQEHQDAIVQLESRVRTLENIIQHLAPSMEKLTEYWQQANPAIATLIERNNTIVDALIEHGLLDGDDTHPAH